MIKSTFIKPKQGHIIYLNIRPDSISWLVLLSMGERFLKNILLDFHLDNIIMQQT